jgi:hypothetical protein
VKPVKTGSFIVQAARYLGALTRCKSLSFPWILRLAPSELRVNPVLVQGCCSIAAARSLMFHFTNSSPVIHVRDRAARIRAVNIEL